MAIEIERKFLIKSDGWKDQVSSSVEIQQGYLSTSPEKTVRVRVKGEQGFLTVKGKNKGMSRLEFEYDIPLSDALSLMSLCDSSVIKKRYLIPQNGVVWEVDEFSATNEGLLVAEVELTSEDQALEIPEWIGKEVTGDIKYYNSNLIAHPFENWLK